MSPPALITQGDMEAHFSAKTVLDLFDIRRAGVVDPERLEYILGGASDKVRGLCLPGFTVDQMTEMCAIDLNARGLVCDVAIGLASRGRPGLIDADGKNPFIAIQKDAMKELKEIVAMKQARFAGEEDGAGVNRKLGLRSNRSPVTPIFAATNTDRVGPGGF